MNYIEKIETILGGQLENIVIETQNAEYNGVTFDFNEEKYRFRTGKITPKKKGAFVVMWKKDENNKNEPYHVDNFPDYLCVIIEDDEQGFLLIPRKELVKNKVISSDGINGKMGFRIYLPDEKELNATARRTQKWQQNFYYKI